MQLSRTSNANNNECVHAKFLGHAPDWYKKIGFLLINPLLLLVAGPYITGWALVLEFIFTSAMALKCYPLQPERLIGFGRHCHGDDLT